MIQWCCNMVVGCWKSSFFKKKRIYESDFQKSKFKTLLLNYITSLAVECILKEPDLNGCIYFHHFLCGL